MGEAPQECAIQLSPGVGTTIFECHDRERTDQVWCDRFAGSKADVDHPDEGPCPCRPALARRVGEMAGGGLSVAKAERDFSVDHRHPGPVIARRPGHGVADQRRSLGVADLQKPFGHPRDEMTAQM